MVKPEKRQWVPVVISSVRRLLHSPVTTMLRLTRRGIRHPWLSLLALIILAVVLGSISILSFPPGASIGGTSNWWPIALNVAGGRGYRSCQPNYFPFCEHTDQMTASREPLPVLLFAGVAAITAESLYMAAIVELLLFVGVLVGIFCLARRLFGRPVALIATLAWVLYLPAYRLIPQVSGDMLATLCLVWAIFAIVRARESDTIPNWLVAGLWLGAGALSRSVLLVVGGALIIWLIPWHRFAHRPQLRLLKPAVMIALGMALVLSPWALRNLRAYGSPIVGTTLSGYNLYRHNAQIEDEQFLYYTSPEQAMAAVQRVLTRRADLRGDENEYEMDQVYREEALRIIMDHPDRYVLLSFYRLLPLWFDYGINEIYRGSPGALEYMILAQQIAMVLCGALGFRLLRSTGMILFVPIAVVNVMHMAVVGRLRFLLVVIPLVIIPMAFLVWNGLKHMRRHLRRYADAHLDAVT